MQGQKVTECSIYQMVKTRIVTFLLNLYTLLISLKCGARADSESD